jgi:mono/diheme cytochrome c family protein
MRSIRLVAALSVALLGARSLSAAQPTAESPEQTGAQLYTTYCASCHGVSGLGDGPLAMVLTVKPFDLTRLGEKYGRPLPTDRIAEFIDGRSDVKAHGPREMPVWGEQLYRGETGKSPAPDSPSGRVREAARRGAIELIIAYLDTIQLPPTPPHAP